MKLTNITVSQLKIKLNEMGDRLVPVAGLLMQIACSNGRVAKEPEIHEEGCKCRVCNAFLTVQDIQNKLEEIIRNVSE